MPRLEKDEQLIDSYIREELTNTEERFFDERLHDKDFKAQLEWQQSLQAAAQKSGRQQAKATVQTWEAAAAEAVPKASFRPSTWRWIIITGAVLLAIFLLWLLTRPTPETPEELFANYFMPYPNIVAPVEKSSDSLTKKTLAFEAYEITAYPQAEVQFIQLEQTPTVQFYRGVTALAQEEPAKAITLLQAVKGIDNRFQQAADWYLALAYLLQNERDTARALLQNIKATSEHPFQERAAELLQELN